MKAAEVATACTEGFLKGNPSPEKDGSFTCGHCAVDVEIMQRGRGCHEERQNAASFSHEDGQNGSSFCHEETQNAASCYHKKHQQNGATICCYKERQDGASICREERQNCASSCGKKDQQDGASFCRFNQQDSFAVDFQTAADRAEENPNISLPNATFSPVAKKQQNSVIGFLPQTPKDLPERITLPPKKRTCMNREINPQCTMIFGKDALSRSNLAIPATFNTENTPSLEFDPRNNLQSEPHVEEASRKILVETGGSSAKYMKPSKLLLRRYKLLSEIV